MHPEKVLKVSQQRDIPKISDMFLRKLGLTLSIFFLLSLPAEMFGQYSCGTRSVSELLKSSDAVFVGRLVKISEDSDKGQLRITGIFETLRSWKGISGKSVEIMLITTDEDGFGITHTYSNLDVGRTYLIYTQRIRSDTENYLNWPWICNGTELNTIDLVNAEKEILLLDITTKIPYLIGSVALLIIVLALRSHDKNYAHYPKNKI